MNPSASIKLEDFINWAKIAFEHYHAARYSDSLTNIRKAGEACCKLLVLKKDERKGEELIKNKSYKELLTVVININAAPRKAINWLETFQILGNKATHDLKVDGIQAEYGYNALKLLTEWLFGEELQISIPPRLIKHIKPRLSEDDLKKQLEKLNNELSATKSQSKKLAEELDRKKASITALPDSERDLKKELEEALEKVKQMEAANERITLLEEQLKTTLKKSQQALKKNEDNEAVRDKLETEKSLRKNERNKKNVKRISLIFILVVLASIAVIYFYPEDAVVPKEDNKTIFANDSSINILILPLAVMQDNPNISFKIEDAISNEIKKQSEERKFNIKVLYDPVNDKPAVSLKEAVEKGKKYNCEIVYYGELYERATADSVDISLKYVFVRPEDFSQSEISGESDIKVFSSLTDKNFTILKGEIANQITLTYVNKLMKKKKWDEVISILQKEKYTTNKMRFHAGTFIDECYLNKGEYKKALEEVLYMYSLFPDSAFAKAELAYIYENDSIKEYEKSRDLFKEVIEQCPNDAKYLTGYASLLFRYLNDTAQARVMLLKAVKAQPDYCYGWQYLGYLMQNYYNDTTKALDYYEKSLLVKPDEPTTVSNIGFLYYNRQDYPKALSYAEKALKIDSTCLGALNVKLWTYYQVKKYDSAYFFGMKALKLINNNSSSADKASVYAGLGLVAYANGYNKNAKSLFEKALGFDSSKYSLYTCLGEIYIYTDKNFDKAYQLFARDLKFNSGNTHTCYNMGIFLALTAKDTKYYNLDKGIKLLEKSYTLDPVNSVAPQMLATYYMSINDYPNAIKYYTAFLKNNPKDYEANYYLASIYSITKDVKMARAYFEKCIDINALKPEPYQELANCYMLDPGKDIVKAEQYAKKSIEIDKNFAAGYFRLADIYIDAGLYDFAWQNYQTALSLDSAYSRNAYFDILFKKLGYTQ